MDEPNVSDHAVLRYLERHYNMDIDAIRAEIMTPVVRQAIILGVNSVTTKGLRFSIKGSTVTTIFKKSE